MSYVDRQTVRKDSALLLLLLSSYFFRSREPIPKIRIKVNEQDKNGARFSTALRKFQDTAATRSPSFPSSSSCTSSSSSSSSVLRHPLSHLTAGSMHPCRCSRRRRSRPDASTTALSHAATTARGRRARKRPLREVANKFGDRLVPQPA